MGANCASGRGANIAQQASTLRRPFAAGAVPDTVARLLADRLTRLWGQQVVVDNRVGVAGLLGAASVAKSPADGYTLVQCNVGTHAIALSLYAKLPFDQQRDFAPITRIGTTPNLIVVHPSVLFRTVKEMIALVHPQRDRALAKVIKDARIPQQ